MYLIEIDCHGNRVNYVNNFFLENPLVALIFYYFNLISFFPVPITSF